MTPASPEPPGRVLCRGTLLRGLAIVATALCIYWPALHGGILWDDDVLVTANANLRDFHGLEKIWFNAPTTDYWPLTWTLLWIEWHLWGIDTLGYHLVSLALHISSGFLIWRVLGRLGLRWGWLGGLLFVVHPLAVESVAWIAEIKNTLSLPLVLFAFDAWLDSEVKPSGYLRSVLFYLAAMLAKTSVVMLPLVLLLYCWWRRGRITRQEFQRTIPYFAIALALGLVTIYFQHRGLHVKPFELGGPVTRAAGAGNALFFYLEKFFLPAGLQPIYPRRPSLSLFQILTVFLSAAVLIVAWTKRGGWGRNILFGFGFYFLNLLPVLGFVSMQYLNVSPVADHLVYLPMIGLAGLVVAGIECAHSRMLPVARPAITVALVVVLGLLARASHQYAGLYVDAETLWTYTVQNDAESWLAHSNRGNALLENNRIPEAVAELNQALQLDPHYVVVYNNLGNAFLRADRVPEAGEKFAQALRLNPDNADAHNGMGLVLRRLGRIPEALDQFDQAVKLEPDDAEAYFNSGVALCQSGRTSEGMAQFEQGLEIDPNDAAGHNDLGNALLRSGHIPEAMDEINQALKLKPHFADAHFNLGVAYLQSGQIPEAIDQFNQALAINPGSAEAHNDLGVALFRTGHVAEATAHFEQALQIQPSYPDARNNLARALQKPATVK